LNPESEKKNLIDLMGFTNEIPDFDFSKGGGIGIELTDGEKRGPAVIKNRFSTWHWLQKRWMERFVNIHLLIPPQSVNLLLKRWSLLMKLRRNESGFKVQC